MSLEENKKPEDHAPKPATGSARRPGSTAVIDPQPGEKTTGQTKTPKAAPQKSSRSAQSAKSVRFGGRSHGAIRRQNRAQCKRCLAAWRRRQAIEGLRERLFKAWMSIPNMEYIADALYMVGFWTEYALVRAGRVLSAVLHGLGHELVRIVTALFVPLFGLIGAVFSDLTSPVRELATDVQETMDSTRGKRRNGNVLLQLLLKIGYYLLPLAALALFVYTTRSILASRFLLEVHVNGQIVGYVETEQIFEGAKEDVQERIANARTLLENAGVDAGDKQWEISPTYTLATEATRNGRIMSQNAMTNAILATNSDEITEGTAIYVDGTLLAILSTTDGQQLSAYLNGLRTEAENSESFQALLQNDSLSDVRVEFKHDIEYGDDQNGVYFTDTVSSYDDVVGILNGGVLAGQTTWQAGADDTLESIAAQYGVTVDSLYEMNPTLASGEEELRRGYVVTIPIYESLLTIEEKGTITWQETIDYDTVEYESDEYYWGDNRTVQEGSDGLMELTADITFQGGVEVSRQVTDETVLLAPVTQEIVKGTRLRNGMTAQYGTGTFIWPVPTYTYVSRWMSSYHKGADICAAYGAPILASDSGVVITSDYHYSYGNYVVIDHGNGYQTLYAHMSQRLVSVGQAVSSGQQIGCVGSTGNSTGNHCHFEMYYNGQRFSAQRLFGGM